MWCFRLCFFSLTNFELLQSQKIFCPILKEPRQPEPEVSLSAWTWLTCEATEKFEKIGTQILDFTVLLLALYFIGTDSPTILFIGSGEFTGQCLPS